MHHRLFTFLRFISKDWDAKCKFLKYTFNIQTKKKKKKMNCLPTKSENLGSVRGNKDLFNYNGLMVCLYIIYVHPHLFPCEVCKFSEDINWLVDLQYVECVIICTSLHNTSSVLQQLTPMWNGTVNPVSDYHAYRWPVTHMVTRMVDYCSIIMLIVTKW